jgi:hypothetical protein
MNLVAIALVAPVVILALFEPSIIPWLAGFVLAYLLAWWLLDKTIGKKPITSGNDGKKPR